MKKHKFVTRQTSRGILLVPCAILALNAHLPAAELLNQNFDADDGGFTVTSENHDDPWAYDAGAGAWSTDGSANGAADEHTRLTSPELTVTAPESFSITFDHRYDIEGGNWDGGGLFVSVNGGPFEYVDQFIENGYNTGNLVGAHDLLGLTAFGGISPGHAAGTYITSKAGPFPLSAGDTIQFQFLMANDQGSVGTMVPNWEIDSIIVDSLLDTDTDGIPDFYEDLNGLDKSVNDAADDPDSDDSSNFEEYLAGTDPQDDDSDDDTLKDGVETNTGIFVSATDTGSNPLKADSDDDGLNDSIETGTGTFANGGDTGTDPNKTDTDEDGVNDGFELISGTDPFDNQSVPGPAPTMTWDASADLDGDNLWTTLEAPAIAGIAWNFGTPKAAVTGTSNFAAVTAWYNSPSATMESFNDAPLSAAPFSQGTNQPVSFELVFRPVDLTEDHLLFETGGNGDGLGIVINGDTLFFRAQDANSDEQRVIASHTFAAGDEANFQHVVGTLQTGEAGTNECILYINGVEVDRVAATGILNDWAGGDNSGLGVLTGSTPTGQNAFAPFTGDVAILRFYAAKVLSAAEVKAAYDGLDIDPDSDSDDLRDSWERANFLDLDEIATGDPDSDGLDNLGELNAGSNPIVGDTDGDSINDSDEVNGAVNPYKDGVLGAVPGDPTLPTNPDSDGDGLDDSAETSNANGFVTNPNNPDTDGDGFADLLEIDNESDPTNIDITPGTTDLTLLAYFNFDGQLADQAGNTPDAVLGGSAVLTTTGMGSSGTAGDEALELGGVNDGAFAQTPVGSHLDQAFINNAMSVAFWQFRTADGNTSAFWLHAPTSSGNMRGFQAHTPWGDGTIYFDQSGCCGPGERLTTTGSNLDVWQHLVFQRDAFGERQIWIDGVLSASSSDADPLDQFDGIITLGAEGPTQANSFGGRIDDFAIFANTLSPDQIMDLVNGANPPDLISPPVPFAITDINYDPETELVTLTWNSKNNRTYSVFSSPDLSSLGEEVDDSIESEGDVTSFSFTSFPADQKKRFFWIQEN